MRSRVYANIIRWAGRIAAVVEKMFVDSTGKAFAFVSFHLSRESRAVSCSVRCGGSWLANWLPSCIFKMDQSWRVSKRINDEYVDEDIFSRRLGG